MTMPPSLVDAFEGDRNLLAWVATLRDSWQREIARWIDQPLSDDAKHRRAVQMAERLLQTMEAESGLPPLLARRLHATPAAAAGWQLMSRHRRLDYLLVIFGARSQLARENQILRWLEACVAKARGRTRPQ